MSWWRRTPVTISPPTGRFTRTSVPSGSSGICTIGYTASSTRLANCSGLRGKGSGMELSRFFPKCCPSFRASPGPWRGTIGSTRNAARPWKRLRKRRLYSLRAFCSARLGQFHITSGELFRLIDESYDFILRGRVGGIAHEKQCG